MNDRKNEVLLEIQQALLGEISSKLRAVIVFYGDNNIHFDCYYDGEILEDDIESMSCVETELISMFPENHEITHAVHRLDYPNPVPKKGIWVYYRREQ